VSFLTWVTPELRVLNESIVKRVCTIHYTDNINKLTTLGIPNLPCKLFKIHKSNISIKQIQIIVKKERTFKLTNNLAEPLSTLVGTAEPNIPQGKNKWFLPLVTRSDAIMNKGF